MSRALIDTSVLIASGDSALRIALPERAAISVITVGELRAGVLRAKSTSTRRARTERVLAFLRVFEAIPVDMDVADLYGESLAWARENRRSTSATDLLIIATAKARELPLLTLDRSQADVAAGVGVETSP